MVNALRPTLRGFTIVELLVVLVLFAIIIVPIADAVSNAPVQARSVSCRANLREIGHSVSKYQATHRGRMPPDIASLIKFSENKGSFMCPVTGGRSPDSTEYILQSYTYRYLGKPRGADVICWDSYPHIPQHSVFVWLNRKRRSVLYADGRVMTLPEDKFDKLRLRGANVILVRS